MLGQRRYDDDDDDDDLPTGFFDLLQTRLSVVGRVLVFPFLVLQFLWDTVWTFLREWTTSRPLPALLLGLPFVLVHWRLRSCCS